MVPLMRILILGLLALVTSGCMSLLYMPRVGPQMFYPPDKLGYQPEDAEFVDREGNRIHGWWFPSRNGSSPATVVHFHGNAENLTSHYTMLAWITGQGFDYFIFDYPGYGRSSGEPDASNTVSAGVAAMEWAFVKGGKRPLIVYGQSLGGIVAQSAVLDTKDRIPICDVVLDSTFASYRSVARRKVATSWWTWILQPVAYLVMSDRHAPEDIGEISPIPSLVIHAKNDNIVEYPNGEDVYSRLKDPKEMWVLEEGLHGGSFYAGDQKLRGRLVERLKRTCGPEKSTRKTAIK